MYVQRYVEARSCNYCCSEKAIRITYSECVFVDSVIRHAKCTHYMLSSKACLAVQYLSTISHKLQDFLKKKSY